MHPLGAYQIRKEVDEEGDSEAEEGLELQNKCSSCRNCPICCYHILSHYNLLSHTYHTIGLAYKFLLTLSVTQVACERTFSTLKICEQTQKLHEPGPPRSIFVDVNSEGDAHGP